MGRYMMNVYRNYRRTKNQKVIRFVYKRPFFCKDKEAHFAYFMRECSNYLRKNFKENDVYFLERQTKIGGLEIWWKNCFLPVTNKVIVIPTMGDTINHAADSYEYFVRHNDDWWSIAKRKCGDGRKHRELANYNGFNSNHKLVYGDIIKIPFYLVNID